MDHDLTFEAIGTKWRIQMKSDRPDYDWIPLIGSIRQRIEVFDKTYSRFRGDSLVSRMAQTTGKFELPPDGFKLLTFYEKLYRVTDGTVTPLIGQVMTDIGYDAVYSLQPKQPRQPSAWDDIISFGEFSITLRAPALLDFGAAGKGCLVDIISRLIQEQGIQEYTVNAGGDILHRSSSSPLVVGLENPFDDSEVIGAVAVTNQSLCGSAGSRRKWSGYTHIVDPFSLRSPEATAAVWVLAADTMTADGLATALFFTAPEKLRRVFDFEYARLSPDMELEYSRGFKVREPAEQHA